MLMAIKQFVKPIQFAQHAPIDLVRILVTRTTGQPTNLDDDTVRKVVMDTL
jgi:hypothetical protein